MRRPASAGGQVGFFDRLVAGLFDTVRGRSGLPVSLGLLLGALLLSGCRSHRREVPLQATRYASTGLGENPLQGDLVPVHDPSLIRAGSTWYAFTTDLPFEHADGFLQVRCSPDAHTWSRCGHVFDTLPAWIHREVPSAVGLWAPEIAYFNGLYHLYYSASSLGSQRSAIGLATNPALDPHAPGYAWTDQGEVLGSQPGDDFNAIDPGILVDPGSRPEGQPDLWLSYGSFWTGIKQRRLDPSTGTLSVTETRVYSLAARPRDRSHAIEGAAMIAHGGWFYLFVSTGVCCEIPIERDTYREVVGRSRSVHGPFVGEDGSKLLDGGGTVLLESNALWLAPGGGSLYQDSATGETLLCFHALRRSENGTLYLWIKQVSWKDDWPVLRDP